MDYKGFEDSRISKLAGKYKIRSIDGLRIASRTYFSLKGLVILSQHLFFQHKESVTINDFKELYSSGFKLAKKINKVPLPRGFQFGYMILPVIASENISNDVLDYVSETPAKHFSIFEFPVVFDLKNDRAIFYRKTPTWGAFFYKDLRDVVEDYIE